MYFCNSTERILKFWALSSIFTNYTCFFYIFCQKRVKRNIFVYKCFSIQSKQKCLPYIHIFFVSPLCSSAFRFAPTLTSNLPSTHTHAHTPRQYHRIDRVRHYYLSHKPYTAKTHGERQRESGQWALHEQQIVSFFLLWYLVCMSGSGPTTATYIGVQFSAAHTPSHSLTHSLARTTPHAICSHVCVEPFWNRERPQFVTLLFFCGLCKVFNILCLNRFVQRRTSCAAILWLQKKRRIIKS